MANYYGDKPYDGPESIAVTMDIGTTNSAVAFVYCCPRYRPKAQMVSHWPGQSRFNDGSKTPTIVSYQAGKLKACAAQAMQDLEEHPENVARWFKLHLHPATMSTTQAFEIPPLPVGVSIERVYADIMRYLMDGTQRFFERTIPNGPEIWARVRNTIIVVLATPNGWGIREQVVLRNAAIRASLVKEETAGQLVQFVTESEASVHYALAYPDSRWLKRNVIFAIIDCGGSTADTTVYRCVSTDPLSLKEACPSECIQAGGIFVDREVEKMLKGKLQGCSLNHPNVIKSMINAFETVLKQEFDGLSDEYNLKFGSGIEKDLSVGINNGKITLSNENLKPAFDIVVDQIIKSCLGPLIKQRAKHAILVGGLADSPYVRAALEKALDKHDISVISGGDSANKAAAEGAVIAHIKQFVVARAAKATFGGCVRAQYEKKLHHERKHTVQVYPDGKQRVDGAFHAWIPKGTVLRGTFAHKLSYHVAWDATSPSETDLIGGLGTTRIEIFAWEGDDIPTWCKDEQGRVMNGMRLICTLQTNLSALAGGLELKKGTRGRRFYQVDYDVCVYFGGTQLRAKLQWKEKGKLREGPVTVMPYLY
ncbi:hypothetical protein M408DRAFT_262801 [Serendipita vermifera MAFF 305830]|uniref:Actin-like ATPase domain-containing protein n=1 Tax=Serendipita vermifera MAFF 305830 TaxID=933852 RepID=A0A0C2X248_SERVB|nr:hypothetical protein M408DRAFT_262801 [Serendipita vermifera MAFF 305830]